MFTNNIFLFITTITPTTTTCTTAADAAVAMTTANTTTAAYKLSGTESKFQIRVYKLCWIKR